MRDIVAENNRKPLIIVAAPKAPGRTPIEKAHVVELAINSACEAQGLPAIKVSPAIGCENGEIEEVYVVEVDRPEQVSIVAHFAKFENQEYVLLITTDRKVGKGLINTYPPRVEHIGELKTVPKAEAIKNGTYTSNLDGTLYWVAYPDNNDPRDPAPDVDVVGLMNKVAGICKSQTREQMTK